MSEKNRTIVNIKGKSYTIVAPETAEYIQRISDFVNEKIEQISRYNQYLTVEKIAVLTAINIADDYFKTLQQIENLKHKRDKPIQEMKNDENSEVFEKLMAEKEYISKENAKLNNKIKELEKQILQKDKELEEMLELV